MGLNTLIKSKYGLEVIKDEEALLYAQTCMENGSDPEEAIQDMKMIDNLLTTERNHLLAFGSVNKTSTGRYRKNSFLHNSLDSVITARASGIEM
jgi:hypothetical protein